MGKVQGDGTGKYGAMSIGHLIDTNVWIYHYKLLIKEYNLGAFRWFSHTSQMEVLNFWTVDSELV